MIAHSLSSNFFISEAEHFSIGLLTGSIFSFCELSAHGFCSSCLVMGLYELFIYRGYLQLFYLFFFFVILNVACSKDVSWSMFEIRLNSFDIANVDNSSTLLQRSNFGFPTGLFLKGNSVSCMS